MSRTSSEIINPNPAPRRGARAVVALQRVALALTEHWLLLLNGLLALYVGGAFAAPLLQEMGFTRLADGLYAFYRLMCHQLPERGYFFFGANNAFFATYPLELLAAHGADASNLLQLRLWEGDTVLGYKTALCQREIAMYGGALASGTLYALLRKWRPPRLSPWLFVLLLLPMILDGGSHLVSEVTGAGWRGENGWAVRLTGGAFPAEWYRGTLVGSLNWLLRTVTGFLFGASAIWFVYGNIDPGVSEVRDEAARQLSRNRARLAQFEAQGKSSLGSQGDERL